MNNIYTYTKLTTFTKCKKQYKDKYITKKTIKTTMPAPANPRIIGKTMHYALDSVNERNAYMTYYLNNFIFKDQEIYFELRKIERMKKAFNAFLLRNKINITETEYPAYCNFNTDELNGQIDGVEWLDEAKTICNIYDYKFSVSKSFDSFQLNLYAYILKQNGITVNNMYYIVCAPSKIKQKKEETQSEYLHRIEKLSFEIELKKIEKDIEIKDKITKMIWDIEHEYDYAPAACKNCSMCNSRDCIYAKNNNIVDKHMVETKTEHSFIKFNGDNKDLLYDKMLELKHNLYIINEETTIDEMLEIANKEDLNVIITDITKLNEKYDELEDYLIAIVKLLASKNKITMFCNCQELNCYYNNKQLKEHTPLYFTKLQKRYILSYFN